MDNLTGLRKQINLINNEILKLLNKRAALVQKITMLKNETGTDYYDPMREAEMLSDILNQNKGPLPDELVKEVFSSIFHTALNYMGISNERKLLVGTESEVNLPKLNEMFDIDADIPVVIAGPCAVENFEYLDQVAKALKDNGVKLIRAGAYKPRTSPYDFQGLKEEGLKILHEVSNKYKLYSVTEVVDTRDVYLVQKYADVLQIGARNMQNFELLKEVGLTNKPIILKRGMSASINELIYAAEYIALQGNRNIILCERGIRTFETKTRNTLDISSIPIIKRETHLPIIVDLSHSLGRKDIVNQLAKAVLAAGADGIMVEVHPKPELALSDSKQQLNIDEFRGMLSTIGY
ncbi:bifunctional 3-deoxy-7-phosphoheptulonate synthase/chorismate mutase [Pseudobacteroides cellulosolvens]|uniref:Phospho-2-dehydro-3-deoxyheptonate aldolase n=1 Tax=Pseudobacteroides cellulosolvens ATCC 35603 = DSM 2933 TaxID=398512 RepID=A0A0L6JSI2_9FIRM|nr:bifunctional 3-deoxy-7-phosphoheptulonate synthase/chorismate mutase [Pseudobacteroides cellulosolvens]KNY28685.1 phospho-2-dehydro-3-deoxyheptonate aldolase [Pseudobacteroides cellulosolvens ATCC 35603 = DSM 2933]